MNTIKTEWEFGNFSLTLELNAADDLLHYLACEGLKQITQRGPAMQAEKACAGHTWPKGKRGNPIRPAEFKRHKIDYNEENATKVKEAFSAFEIELNGEQITVQPTVTVTEKIREEAAPMKRANAIYTEAEKAGKLAEIRKKLRIPSLAGREEVVEAIHARLTGKDLFGM